MKLIKLQILYLLNQKNLLIINKINEALSL